LYANVTINVTTVALYVIYSGNVSVNLANSVYDFVITFQNLTFTVQGNNAMFRQKLLLIRRTYSNILIVFVAYCE